MHNTSPRAPSTLYQCIMHVTAHRHNTFILEKTWPEKNFGKATLVYQLTLSNRCYQNVALAEMPSNFASGKACSTTKGGLLDKALYLHCFFW